MVRVGEAAAGPSGKLVIGDRLPSMLWIRLVHLMSQTRSVILTAGNPPPDDYPWIKEIVPHPLLLPLFAAVERSPLNTVGNIPSGFLNRYQQVVDPYFPQGLEVLIRTQHQWSSVSVLYTSMYFVKRKIRPISYTCPTVRPSLLQ